MLQIAEFIKVGGINTCESKESQMKFLHNDMDLIESLERYPQSFSPKLLTSFFSFKSYYWF